MLEYKLYFVIKIKSKARIGQTCNQTGLKLVIQLSSVYSSVVENFTESTKGSSLSQNSTIQSMFMFA